MLLHFRHVLSTAISSRNHVTTLILDFERAFDRIGIHVALRQLIKWNVGKNIFNLRSFLSNRTFRVKINNKYSDKVPLSNCIAQSSLTSVVCFIIAFDEVSKIIANYRVEHAIYADDVLIFSKNYNLNHFKDTFSNIFNDISEWA